MLKAFQECFRLGFALAGQREGAESPPEADRPEGGEERAARKYRAELLQKLAEAESGLTARWGPEAAATARRMVTVWLDETLIQAPWPGQKQWLRRPLQSEWGEGRGGGLWFFQQLESLDPARRDDQELAALALRCVSLEARGCYGRDMERLDQVRRETQARFDLRDQTPIFPPPLPPDGRPKAGLASLLAKLAAASAAIWLAAWLAGGFSLDRALADLTAAAPAAAGPDHRHRPAGVSP